MNSIFNKPTPQPSTANMVEQFKQFKNSFRGEPKQVVMQMLQSGQITEAQLQQAMQMANSLKDVLK